MRDLMKKCKYCIQDIHDEATRCPHCTSSLSEPGEGRYTTYVIDRDLVRFFKMSGATLAIFLTVGASLYGFDLRDAVKEVRHSQDEMEKLSSEMKLIKKESDELLSDARR